MPPYKILLYNTLSEQKEILMVPKGRPLRLFVCGPTVYDYAHIGNARTYLIFDILVRYLRSLNIKVFYLQNITDIDDKIIQRAHQEKTNWRAVAKKFKRAYFQDMRQLGITTVTKYAPATKYIKQIIRQITVLLNKDHAYKIEGDGYYFDITTFSEYGKLAKRTAEQAEDAISRIDEGVKKRHRGDFALWKFATAKTNGSSKDKMEEPYWDTSLGRGRPGWHIEDTAISEYYFGPQYDIHGGAVDLKFPHHEAEIAQQESASGKKPFVKIWMHVGFLLVNGQKMSKSLGNFISIRDFLKKYPAVVLRYIVASHHYRSPIDYSDALAQQAYRTLDGLAQFIAKLKMVNSTTPPTGIKSTLAEAEAKFNKSLADDFNTPEALAVIFGLINELNPKIWSLNRPEARLVHKWIMEKLQKIFNLRLIMPKIPLKIMLLVKKRELFRSYKQFIPADDLRKKIEALGYTIDDTPKGPFVWPKISF